MSLMIHWTIDSQFCCLVKPSIVLWRLFITFDWSLNRTIRSCIVGVVICSSLLLLLLLLMLLTLLMLLLSQILVADEDILLLDTCNFLENFLSRITFEILFNLFKYLNATTLDEFSMFFKLFAQACSPVFWNPC